MFHKQFRLEEQPHPANNKAPSADGPLMSRSPQIGGKEHGMLMVPSLALDRKVGEMQGFHGISQPFVLIL